jgi:hypothetical protein
MFYCTAEIAVRELNGECHDDAPFLELIFSPTEHSRMLKICNCPVVCGLVDFEAKYN